MNIIDVCAKIAKEIHADAVDRAGVDYYEGHLSTVADSVKTELEKCVAYLHDSIEDTDLNEESLFFVLCGAGVAENTSRFIVDKVLLLTKTDDVIYDEYIEKIKSDRVACAVKIADLIHNMDLSRLNVVTEKDVARNVKYLSALKKLLS